ncbi:MAG: DNA-processing protein DprA [Candidatus Anstonellales archaeon]
MSKLQPGDYVGTMTNTTTPTTTPTPTPTTTTTNNNNTTVVAVVGSRNIDQHVASFTWELGRVLAPHYTIVTGMARGVDSIIAVSTLAANGRVIGIIPFDVNRDPPPPSPSTTTSDIISFCKILGKERFKLINLNLPHTKSAYYIRNKVIADNSYHRIIIFPRQGTSHQLNFSVKGKTLVYSYDGNDSMVRSIIERFRRIGALIFDNIDDMMKELSSILDGNNNSSSSSSGGGYGGGGGGGKDGY